jgi:DNA-binding NarL/FixJ family response regulator
MASALDCDLLALWCRHHLACDVVECETDLELGLQRCRTLRPRLLAVDPAIARDAITRATATVREGAAEHLLVLDRRPFEIRLATILHEPAVSYLSRATPAPAAASAIAEILQSDSRVFDPALAHRVRRTGKGYQLVETGKDSLLTVLTPRERQVMQLLAEGKTVPQCAEALGLARSTIDNHKARLMKKLSIHRSSELTVRAIQEGLVHF